MTLLAFTVGSAHLIDVFVGDCGGIVSFDRTRDGRDRDAHAPLLPHWRRHLPVPVGDWLRGRDLVFVARMLAAACSPCASRVAGAIGIAPVPQPAVHQPRRSSRQSRIPTRRDRDCRRRYSRRDTARAERDAKNARRSPPRDEQDAHYEQWPEAAHGCAPAVATSGHPPPSALNRPTVRAPRPLSLQSLGLPVKCAWPAPAGRRKRSRARRGSECVRCPPRVRRCSATVRGGQAARGQPPSA